MPLVDHSTDASTLPGGSAGAAVRLKPDRVYPPGATLAGDGVHFTLYSQHATAVDLCLYDPADPAREIARVRLARDANDFWYAFVPGIGVGTLYGYRCHGPWKPDWGLWFNPAKLLLDPYAKAIAGLPHWRLEYQGMAADGGKDARDSGAVALKSVVVDDGFDWEDDAAPRTPWGSTSIYEMHVRGFSKTHPDVPTTLQGTYAGLAHPASIAYLRELGITAVQLLPVHQHLDDGFLLEKGLTNYWGYNTLGFFAPHAEYAAASHAAGAVAEFKKMVLELHRSGIEVILDVVYNHTAEGDEKGPHLFLRGIDNPRYYMMGDDLRTLNYTGCGNTVNAATAPALRLIMDSLRYWVQEMHVDGFRFDLGATLGRNGSDFNRECAFFQALAQDPVLSQVKLIAEPWDMGPNGYQIGAFPKPWHELNGRYRDTVRKFWCGDVAQLPSFAKRFCGSSDIYGSSGRSPLASVNFITSHDGFPLRDLWTYNEKHNEANGEGNRDGDSNNHSWNCGVEGETDDLSIKALRRQLTRSMLATSFCSLGVPFICAGDECWRTQRGNNNAYCQDNELSWFDWDFSAESQEMLAYTKALLRFRAAHPIFQRATHFTGQVNPISGRMDVTWLTRLGQPMNGGDWHSGQTSFFAALFDVSEGDTSAILLLFNGPGDTVEFPLPPGAWTPVFDTALEPSFYPEAVSSITGTVICAPRSVACLVLKL